MKVAKKLEDPNPWFAWIPILNVILQFRLGDKSPYSIFLVLVPFIGPVAVFVVSIMAYMNICEKLGRDKMLGLLKLAPIGEAVLLGVLAWGNPEEKK